MGPLKPHADFDASSSVDDFAGAASSERPADHDIATTPGASADAGELPATRSGAEASGVLEAKLELAARVI